MNNKARQQQMKELYEERYGDWPIGILKIKPPQDKGWAQIFVVAEKPIPEEWREAFLEELVSEDSVYRKDLEQDIRYYGVRFS